MTDRELLESLVQKVTNMDERMSGMESSLQEVKAGQLRMENKFDEKIGALTDAFTLCSEKIDTLNTSVSKVEYCLDDLSLDELATKDDIKRLGTKFEILNNRLFENETTIQLLKSAK